MAARRSRTYRICLSHEGTELFLSCHCRLARLMARFIPYGATLFVAVLLAEASDPAELVAELEDRSINRLFGSAEHFVGASGRLSNIVEAICDRLIEQDGIRDRPPVARIQLASLTIMAGSEDGELVQGYHRMLAMIEDH